MQVMTPWQYFIVLRVVNLSRITLLSCTLRVSQQLHRLTQKSPRLKRKKAFAACDLPYPSLIPCVFMRDSRGLELHHHLKKLPENFTSVKHRPKTFELQHQREGTLIGKQHRRSSVANERGRWWKQPRRGRCSRGAEAAIFKATYVKTPCL
jgi:hypothetical protein